jgi:hypothetical protein
MTKRTRRHSDSVAGATRRIIAIVAGKGVAERIAADARRPRKFSRDDGVVFDPKWQDDAASFPPRKQRTMERTMPVSE